MVGTEEIARDRDKHPGGTFYVGYVDHMLRFYCKYPDADTEGFRTELDRQNWYACCTVVNAQPEKLRQAIVRLYRDHIDPEEIAREVRINPNRLHKMIRHVREEIARERGLV